MTIRIKTTKGKNDMKGLTAKTWVAVGQAGLMVSLLLTAAFLGLIPDAHLIYRENRAALAEAIAANTAGYISQQDINRLEATLNLVVERNDALLSAGLRKAQGELIVNIADHHLQWQQQANHYSTDTHTQVPIWLQDSKWGQVELRFRPLTAAGWQGTLRRPLVQLGLFIGFCSFGLFYFYLSRMLKQLDPSQAVPARVRSALDTLAEGLLVLDQRENIVLANRAFASIVGRTPSALLGRSASDFTWTTLDGESLTSSEAPWINVLQRGKPQKDYMMRLVLPDKSQRTFIVNCAPIFADNDKVAGVLVSLDDVTQLEANKVALRHSKDEAEAANRAKSDFLAHMSHEIRTPMNSILGFTQLLERGYGKNPEETQRYLQTIYASGKHLLDLINDILDLSKVESGRLELEQTPVNPHLIVREVIQVLGLSAREKRLELSFEAEGMIPETILSDSGRLRQIITNLVSNAIKFTEQGHVKIIARRVVVNSQERLELAVQDTGIGINAAAIDSVFDPFVQADNSIARRFKGTGLGLAISRQFARALGGDISVCSQPGAGSTFTLTLDPGPLHGVRLLDPDEIVITSQALPMDNTTSWQFPPARLLVVDDGAENRELVTLVLEQAGLAVETAENGQIGVEKALSNPFDLILMDIQMPVMDGYSAIRLLRAQGIHIPVIAFTANAMKGFEQECVAAGFSGYMTKPIDIDGLLQRLVPLLGGRRFQPAACTSTATPSQPPSRASASPTPAPDSPLRSRLADHPRFAAIIEKFVVRLNEQLLVMERAREAKDYAELARLAHWLKGAGGTVGFDVLIEPAQELEASSKVSDARGVDANIDILQRLAQRIALPFIDKIPEVAMGAIES